MKNYGRIRKRIAAFLVALAVCAVTQCELMAATLSGTAATGDETPIIALVLCILGVAIIVVALKKRK